MCLYVERGMAIKTAKQDITVYKMITKNNISVYQNFKYEPNTLYRLRKKLVAERVRNNTIRIVNSGFHAFRNNADSYALKAINTNYSNEKYVEFTIPKGAKYYIGEYGDIVSTSIRSGSLKRLRA